MSEADIALVHRVHEAFNDRFEELRGDGLEPFHREFFVADSVIHNADAWPVAATYEGFAGYREWWDDTYTSYEDVRWTVESTEAVGELIVVGARISGRPIGDPTVLEVRIALTYAVRGGRIARIDSFLTENAAFDHARAQG